MSVTKEDVEAWVEADRDTLIDFLQTFIRCRSPNPPGDTLEAAGHVRSFLDGRGLDYEVIAPNEAMPNIVASFDGGGAGARAERLHRGRGVAHTRRGAGTRADRHR